MARRVTRDVSHFTPLLESGGGLRSRSTAGRPVYKGVTIIKAGLGNSRDRNYYPAATLEKAIKEGRFDGLRAYADHPDSVSEEIQPERTIRDLVGVYQNPRFVREGREGGRVVANLHLFRSAKWLGDMVDDLLDLGQADKIGLSINGRGRTVEKSMQLEESADPVDVNYVEEFMTLRSADVVTEAGAGGGFQQLLESAKSTTQTKENGMKGPNAKQKKAIAEAQRKGDWDAVAKILKECGCGGSDAVKETTKGAAAKGKKADVEESKKGTKAKAKAEDAAAEDDEDPVTDDEDDADAELDAAHEEVVAEADEDAPDDEDDEATDDEDDIDEADVDDVDESDDEDDLDEADEDADDDEPVRRGNGKHALSGAAEKIRANAGRRTTEGSKQPIVKGGAGVVTRGRKARGSTKVKGPGNGKTAFVGVAGLRGRQTGMQKGRRFGESDETPSLGRLQKEIEKLRETNTRLSTQLRVRTTADRARNLLRESSIPERLRPEILRSMVGKSEEEMQRVVRYHERLIEAAVEGMDGGEGRVEAGGTRFRESHHAGGSGDDLSSLLEESGIPMNED